MKIYPIVMIAFCILWNGCAHPNQSSIHHIFEKDKVSVNFSSFFDEKGNRDIENLSLALELTPAKNLIQPLSQKGCSLKYDNEGEKKTIESLESYLAGLKQYNRYVVDFSVDSLKIKVFATGKLDVLHIIVLNKYNTKYHFINESFFVFGTILKITERDIRSNNGDFNDVAIEKLTTSLFDQNRLFYMTEEKENGHAHALHYNDESAFLLMQDAFMMRQFCHDVLLKLKEQHADWFEDKAGNL